MAREGSPTETGLYLALEKHLKQAKQPMTCVDLFEKSDVRAKAQDANQVSDALGHLWRRDFVKRVPAPKTPHSQARWAYWWPDEVSKVAPDLRREAIEATAVHHEPARVLLSRPTVTVTESGGVIEIELPQLSIRIATK